MFIMEIANEASVGRMTTIRASIKAEVQNFDLLYIEQLNGNPEDIGSKG